MSWELDENGLVEALAAMRAERDEQSSNATKWFQNFSAAVRRAEAAEAQVQRLTEENEALRKAMSRAHELAADARDRRSSMREVPPDDIVALVEATRPISTRSALKENAL